MIKSVMIRQATKAGCIEWQVGGVADLSFPTSKTRRGRVQENGNVCPTLMANNQDLFKLEEDSVKKYRIRKLTPRECWRLMGFSDEDFDKAAAVNSNTQLYSQAGNSIVVNVLEGIFKQMIQPEECEEELQEESKGNEDIKEPIKQEEVKEPAKQIEVEKKPKVAAGFNINLPFAPDSDIWIIYRGVVLKCRTTYFAIYRDSAIFNAIAYDQDKLKSETGDLMYLWNHDGKDFKISDVGKTVFTSFEAAVKKRDREAEDESGGG